jgi:SSS family solute:Na+ symporter
VAAITLSHSAIKTLLPFLPQEMNDINVGFVALALNVVVTAVVSAVTQPTAAAAKAERA